MSPLPIRCVIRLQFNGVLNSHALCKHSHWKGIGAWRNQLLIEDIRRKLSNIKNLVKLPLLLPSSSPPPPSPYDRSLSLATRALNGQRRQQFDDLKSKVPGNGFRKLNYHPTRNQAKFDNMNEKNIVTLFNQKILSNSVRPK